MLAPSDTAMPADSWPRCWRANSPKNVSRATSSPGAHTPKSPHASFGPSSSSPGSNSSAATLSDGTSRVRPDRTSDRGVLSLRFLSSCHRLDVKRPPSGGDSVGGHEPGDGALMHDQGVGQGDFEHVLDGERLAAGDADSGARHTDRPGQGFED